MKAGKLNGYGYAAEVSHNLKEKENWKKQPRIIKQGTCGN